MCKDTMTILCTSHIHVRYFGKHYRYRYLYIIIIIIYTDINCVPIQQYNNKPDTLDYHYIIIVRHWGETPPKKTTPEIRDTEK